MRGLVLGLTAGIAALLCGPCSLQVQAQSQLADEHGGEVLLVSGDRYYLIHLHGDGGPQICELTNVVRVGPAPDPVPDDSVRGQVKQWTASVADPTIAQALARGYDEIAKLLKDGKLNWPRAKLAVGSVTALAVSNSQRPEKWQSWRTNVGELFDAAEQQGHVNSKDEQLAFLGDISAGLRDASNQQAIDDALLQAIIDAIMELIKAFTR